MAILEVLLVVVVGCFVIALGIIMIGSKRQSDTTWTPQLGDHVMIIGEVMELPADMGLYTIKLPSDLYVSLKKSEMGELP